MEPLAEEQTSEVVMPSRYRQDPRLTLWFKCGFNQARKGIVPAEDWIRRIDQDKAVSEAFHEGHRAGESLKGFSLVASARWAR